MLLVDGFEDAFLGVGMRCGQPDIAVYDWHICVQVLMDRDGMTEEEAEEWMSFNVVGAWVGEMTPIFVMATHICDLDLEASGY
jgi:fucose permease